MALARFDSVAQDELGNVLASPTVEVRLEATSALAALYSDRDGAVPITNPFTGGVDGSISFHVVGGAYRIDANSGLDTKTLRYVPIGTAAEYDAEEFIITNQEVNVKNSPYNAVGDGIVDDTAAFTLALSTGHTVIVPPGSYVLSSKLTVTGSGQRIVGAGPHLTVLIPDGFSDDVIEFSGGNRGGGVENLSVDGSAQTSDFVISVYGYDRTNFKNLSFTDVWNGIRIELSNGSFITDFYNDNPNGPYGILWYGTASTRSDVLSLINCVQGSGAATTAITMDGNVNTLRIHGGGCSAMGMGIKTQSTFDGSLPLFIMSHDFEIDFPQAGQCIHLSGGFRGGYFTNTYLHGSTAEANVKIDATTYDCSFIGGTCSSAWKQGFDIAGRFITVQGMHISFNSQSASAAHPAILLAATAIGITINGNHGGSQTGVSAARHSYGVVVTAGAVSYRIFGNDFHDNVTGAVNDLANDFSFSPPRSIVAFNAGSNVVRMGSQAVWGASTDAMAWWGGTPTTKAAVTGSRGGNAALASLLAILAGYGLITDSSSA
jgi:hypothetical protein